MFLHQPPGNFRLDQVPKIHCPDVQVSSLYRFVATGKEHKLQGIFSPLDLATTKQRGREIQGFLISHVQEKMQQN